MNSPAGANSAIVEVEFSLAAIAALRKLMLRRGIADRRACLGYIARTVTCLVADDAGFITDSTISVNGGNQMY